MAARSDTGHLCASTAVPPRASRDAGARRRPRGHGRHRAAGVRRRRAALGDDVHRRLARPRAGFVDLGEVGPAEGRDRRARGASGRRSGAAAPANPRAGAPLRAGSPPARGRADTGDELRPRRRAARVPSGEGRPHDSRRARRRLLAAREGLAPCRAGRSRRRGQPLRRSRPASGSSRSARRSSTPRARPPGRAGPGAGTSPPRSGRAVSHGRGALRGAGGGPGRHRRAARGAHRRRRRRARRGARPDPRPVRRPLAPRPHRRAGRRGRSRGRRRSCGARLFE